MTVQEHQNDLFRLSREIKGYTVQVAEMKETFDSLKEQHDALMQLHNTVVGELLEEITALKVALKAREREVADLTKRVDYLERYSEKLKSELTDYQANPARIGEGWVSHDADVFQSQVLVSRPLHAEAVSESTNSTA